MDTRAHARIDCRQFTTIGSEATLPSHPLPPETHAEVENLARAIREAVDAEVDKFASARRHRRRPPLRGLGFQVRARTIAAKALAWRLEGKKTATREPS